MGTRRLPFAQSLSLSVPSRNGRTCGSSMAAPSTRRSRRRAVSAVHRCIQRRIERRVPQPRGLCARLQVALRHSPVNVRETPTIQATTPCFGYRARIGHCAASVRPEKCSCHRRNAMKAEMTAELHEVRFSIVLTADRRTAWQALTESVDDWWPADYRATSGPGRMILESCLGGRLWETSINSEFPGNGVLWYQVVALEAPSSIVLSGFLAPPFGGPALSLLRLSLHDGSKGTCSLEVHDSIIGRVDANKVRDGWRAIFGGLAAYWAS